MGARQAERTDSMVGSTDAGHEGRSHRHDGEAGGSFRRILFVATGIAMLLSLASRLLGMAGASDALGIVAGFAGIACMLPEAIRDIAGRKFTMSLMTVTATVTGILVGEPMEAGMVIFLYEVGKMLEDWATDRASDALSEMENLMPSQAHVVMHDGEVINMPLSDLGQDTVVRVLVGERVPTDGTIVKGESEFDESHVSGESAPVPHGRTQHSDVVGGSLNVGSVIEMRVTALPEDSTVSRIANLTRQAKDGRIPHQGMLDAFAERYTPAIAVLSLLVALAIPSLMRLLGMDVAWLDWFRRGVALLVIGCPCSVVIGIPVAFVSGICSLARHGVVVRGADVMEVAGDTDLVMLDKTGTITTGRMSVDVVVLPEGEDPLEPVLTVMVLESASNHPVAQPLTAYAGTVLAGRSCDIAVGKMTEVPGRGMTGTVNGCRAYVGRIPDGSDQLGGDASGDMLAAAEEISVLGLTPVIVVTDGRARMLFGIGNEVRDGARQSVAAMHEATGNMPMMVTGDARPVSLAIAGAVGIPEGRVTSSASPAAKMEKVLSAQADGYHVLMVGDGINDAPALAHADVGMAVGSLKSDVSFGVADAIAMGNPLDAVNVLIATSRHVMGLARTSLVLALAAKAVATVLVMAGAMGMGLAVFADTGMTLVVSLIGLSVLRYRPDGQAGGERDDDGQDGMPFGHIDGLAIADGIGLGDGTDAEGDGEAEPAPDSGNAVADEPEGGRPDGQGDGQEGGQAGDQPDE